MNVRTLVIGAAGFVLAFSGHAAAAPASAGEFQISLPLNLATVSYGREVLGGSHSSFGAAAGAYSPSAVVFGYALSEQWLLGAYAHYFVDDEDGQPLDEHWEVGPRVTYVLRPGEPVRPFLGAGVHIGHRSWRDINDKRIGARIQAGTMIELVEGFSVDPSVDLGYSFDSWVHRAEAGEDKRQRYLVSLSAAVAFTAWL